MKNYKKYIFTGLMSAIPITITYWIIQKLFTIFSIPGKTFINAFTNIFFDYKHPYLIKIITLIEYVFGFILTILFLYLLGLIISNVLGKRIY